MDKDQILADLEKAATTIKDPKRRRAAKDLLREAREYLWHLLDEN